jgi:hypothetical protein
VDGEVNNDPILASRQRGGSTPGTNRREIRVLELSVEQSQEIRSGKTFHRRSLGLLGVVGALARINRRQKEAATQVGKVLPVVFYH